MALPASSPSPDHKPSLGLVQELFEDARQEKRQYLESWNRFYRLVRNRSWSPNRPNWLPSPQASEVQPTIHTLVSWMSDQRPKIFASPHPQIHKFLEDGGQPPDEELIRSKAQDMTKVLDSWWVTQNIHSQLQCSLWDLFIFGAAILKTGWDPFASDGEGEAFLRRMDPYAALPDPAGSSMEDIRYFLDVRRVPMFEIRSRFPERGHLVTPDQGSPTDVDRRPKMRGLEVVAQGQLGATGVTGAYPGVSTPGIPPLWGPPGTRDMDYTGTALLKECWIRNTRRTTLPLIGPEGQVDEVVFDEPYWELICEANGVLLSEDTTSPLPFNQAPFTRIPYVENGEFWSMSLLEQLGPAQIAENRLLAAMQINAELLGNPILLEDNESGISRTKITNRPGGRLTKNPGREVRWMDPPQMPPVVIQLIEFWRGTIDRISGISAVARGTSLRRREPAAAVDAVQEASFVRVRDTLRNMEVGLKNSLEQVSSIMTNSYVEPRAVPLVGPSGSEDYLQLGYKPFTYPQPDMVSGKVTDIPIRFDVWTQAGSSLPISRQARAAEIDALYQMQVVDEQAVIEAHDLPDQKELIARMDQRRQQMMAAEAQAAQGKG